MSRLWVLFEWVGWGLFVVGVFEVVKYVWMVG